jgi:hypothetical protein
MTWSDTAPRCPDIADRKIKDLSAGRVRRAMRTMRRLGLTGTVALAREHGFQESLHFAARNIRHIIAHRNALRWDRAYGVETAGSIQIESLSVVGENRKFGNECVCTSPKSFDFMMQNLPHDLHDHTFVDFGAGKSRTLLLASRYGFGKIIGVEFARELTDCSRKNIARFSSPWQKSRDFEIIHADATEFALPRSPLAIFFYNPFKREVFDIVLNNIVASLNAARRPCHIIYGSSSHDAIDWAAAAILASGRFAAIPVKPMPMFFDAVRTIRYAVFRAT